MEIRDHMKVNMYIIKSIKILLVILFTHAWFLTTAQTYNFKAYRVEDGLAQSYVYSVLQDRSGYLWIGTGEGLSRFDGRKFVTFREQDGLASNFITSMLLDKDNNLWIGHFQGQITKYDGDSFNIIDSGTIANTPINTIYEDFQGNILFGTQRSGIISINKTGDIHLFKDTLTQYLINSISQCDNTNLFVGTTKGLLKFDYTDRNKLVLKSSYANISSVQSLTKIKDKQGFWIGTSSHGIYEFYPETSEFQKDSFIQYNIKDGLLSNNVNEIYQENNNTLWISFFGKGLSKVRKSKERDINNLTIKNFQSGKDIDTRYIRSMIQDREGSIWLGTSGGVIQFSGEVFSSLNVQNGLSDDNVLSLFKDIKGYYWFGTEDGLNKCSIDNSIIEITNYLNNQDFPANDISAINQDPSGKMWIGTRNNGILLLDTVNYTMIPFLEGNNLSRYSINAIVRDNQDNMWIATPLGAYKYNTLSKELSLLTTLDGLIHNNIYSIFIDSKDNIWFALHGESISVIRNNKIENIKLPDELLGINANCITEDYDGNIWIGTDGQGIFKMSDDKVIAQYKASEGLASNYCYLITVDTKNRIWIGHKNGMSVFDQKNNSCIVYGKYEGFIGIETNFNAVLKDENDNIWFGTTEGIVRYDPENDIHNVVEPIMNITKAIINNKEQNIQSSIELPYGQYNIKFEFLGISMKEPEKIRYRYKLEGFNSDWTEITAERLAAYPRLEDGQYVFKVISSNNEGVWNKKPATFSFTIAPPFWKTWWFWIITTLSLFTAIYIFIRWRTAALIKEKETLEKLVDQRTLSLKKEKEKVAEQAQNITDSINYAKHIQEAILPVRSDIYKAFPESFIIFYPRDIVSGDFYWFSQRNKLCMIAAADSTGHGVPGAFMSMIGNTLLNQIVNEKKISVPGKILQALNTEVTNALKDKRDGMDVALCTINIESKTLDFSGAYRPLYWIRDNKLEIIKGAMGSIGGDSQIVKNYTTTRIDIKKGDTFYIFSDGFVDQFGGKDNKKFMTKEFKKMLLSVQHLDMEAQKTQISKIFHDWKGDYEQLDDVLVIGLRF